MAVVQRSINQCDVCGHEWIPRSDSKRCGNTACRSTKWNGGDSSAAEQRSARPPAAGSSPAPRSNADIQSLRDICAKPSDDAGRFPVGAITSMFPPTEPDRVKLCPKVGFNEADGESYRCALGVGHKGNCKPGERV